MCARGTRILAWLVLVVSAETLNDWQAGCLLIPIDMYHGDTRSLHQDLAKPVSCAFRLLERSHGGAGYRFPPERRASNKSLAEL